MYRSTERTGKQMNHNYEHGTDADYYDNEVDRDYDEPKESYGKEDLCTNCNGSGEGMYDGSTCYVCKGHGTIIVNDDEQDIDDEYDKENDDESL